MTPWDSLDRELAAWQAADRRASLWWRDDDAYRDSVPLQRLLDLAESHDVPVALATIPAALDTSLHATLSRRPVATVVQHGYAHRSHAPAHERRAELGAHRPIDDCVSELAAGRATLAAAFGERFASVLVPPWNRIDATVAAALPRAGFHGLSTYGARGAAFAAPGLVQCNTHVDVVAWREGRGFVGAEAALDRLVGHLAARRDGRVDAAEATGILTHHADHAAETWAFLDALLRRTRSHPAVEWCGVASLFGARPAALTSSRSA